MGTTVESIANQALSFVFSTVTIKDLDTDKGTAADQLRIHYEPSRRFVLAQRQWNFATPGVTLALQAENVQGWGFAYEYPSKALQFIEIKKLYETQDPIPYDVQLIDPEAEMPSILTHMPEAIGRYIKDVTNPGNFSAAFEVTFAWYLASRIAMGLTGDIAMEQRALKGYINALLAGSAMNSNEGRNVPQADASWIEARDLPVRRGLV